MAPARTILVALEARLVRGADGRIYSPTGVDGLAFWERYREVFATVLVAARTADGDATGLAPVEGPGIRVVPLPAYDGPWGFAAARGRVVAALRAGIAGADVLCLRAPGAISALAWRLRGDRPVGVEVVGDPHDALAPGVVRSTLRPLARLLLVRALRSMCAGADAVAYVARDTLPRRYPTRGWWTACSDVELDDAAFAGAAALATRAARLRVPRSAAEPWHVVLVGSLAQRYKGPDVLIDAVARCRAAGVPLVATLVGDGRHRSALAADATARGLDGAVRFAGRVAAGDGVRAVLDGADIFVLPSRTEGLPRALLEAMARGVPAFGSRVGGIPELVPEERLVPPGDASALAAALARAIRDPAALAAASGRDHACARAYHADRLRPRRREFYARLSAAVEAPARADRGRVHDSAVTPSLGRNAAWALAGNLGYAACQWAILIAIAKLGTAADVGRFALALALTAPAMMLANLHLRAIQATDARGEHPFRVYFRLRLLTTGGALLAIAVTAAALGYRGPELAIVLAVAAAKGVESLSDVTFGLLQHAERLRRIAGSMLAKGALSVVAMTGVLALGGGILTASAAMAVAWAVIFLATDLPAALRLAPIGGDVPRRALTALAGLALPMGCVMALNTLTANVPRYAIAASLGPTGLGHFAALVSLLVAATQPLLAIGAAVSPRLARHFVEDPTAYRMLTRRLLAIAVLGGGAAIAGAALGGRAVLALAYAPEYAAYAPALSVLAAAAAVGFVASAFGVAVTAARRFRAQFAIAVIALAVCAAASHTLVPVFGLHGAALAMLAGEATRLIALATVYLGVVAPRRERREPSAVIRVLHVFGSMERGGAETRTVEMMRRLDRERYAFDFCVLSGIPGAYAAEIARLGGRVVPCPRRPRLTFAPRFAALVRGGAYDVVDSHVHHFSGVILLLARLAGIRRRIAHIRTTHDGHAASVARRAYRGLTRALLARSATATIGVSETAMAAFFGDGWGADERRQIIYNGIERARLGIAADRARVRSELDVAADRPLLVHVGNFTAAKNHAALVAIAAATIAVRDDVVIVLVGDGPLRADVAADVARRGLASWFRFAGARADVPRLLAAADLFVFPSRWEGLPGAVLEALAAGLPVVASPIPAVLEIARHTPVVTVAGAPPSAVPIVTADPADPGAFAAAIVERLGARRTIAPPTATVLPHAFTVEVSMERLLACYR